MTQKVIRVSSLTSSVASCLNSVLFPLQHGDGIACLHNLLRPLFLDNITRFPALCMYCRLFPASIQLVSFDPACDCE